MAPSDKQIETVEIGGNVWMAFNARSRDLDDQIYPLDGATIEDMYRTSWINTVDGLFQSGRLYMYVPWQGYNPSNNLGNQVADTPWQKIPTCLVRKVIGYRLLQNGSLFFLPDRRFRAHIRLEMEKQLSLHFM